MFNSVLVVCVGNICRSPVGERLLARALPDLRVESAGINALVGHAADATTAEVAATHGLSLEGHAGRQLTADMAAEFDLILALQNGHRRVIGEIAPAATGKTMLMSQWMGQVDIPDPYQRERAFHEEVFGKMLRAADGWAEKLGAK